MKAVIYKGPRKLVFIEVQKPSPKEDEVLVKVEAVGICGSDIRYYMGENPWALHTLGRNIEENNSFILGHEVSGIITGVGDWSEKKRIGERVGILAFKGCGECYYCYRNLPNLCAETLHIGHDGNWKDINYPPGGYAEYIQVWSDKAVTISNNISYEEATQLDGLAVAIHANKIAGVSPGDSVLVIGTGAIGLMLLQVARIRGASTVIAVDKWDLPLKLAADLKADYTFISKEVNIVNEVKKLTGGIGVNVCFDTVGMSETIRNGIKSLARKGRLVMLAVNRSKLNLCLTDLSGEKAIFSSANSQYDDYIVAVDLLSAGRIKVKPFITHVMKLEDYQKAFQMLLKKEKYNVIKLILKP
jgi:2-desacetyl-2-hydroxyethyl bacteriochlorophyllide A dehydrogenase